MDAPSLTVFPTAVPHRVRSEKGQFLEVPAGWELLPPGDAMLTRRVKAGGPTWTLVEKKGRKTFSRGVLAPRERIEAARASVVETREDPGYARKLEAGRTRRAEEQAEYVEDFEGAVRAFLRFAPAFAATEARIAKAVTAHATPVGSGTVARTERIPIERRAEAAVLAWLRHQASDYDDRDIARVRGERREVRREIAAGHRDLLRAHRAEGRTDRHVAPCPICDAAARI